MIPMKDLNILTEDNINQPNTLHEIFEFHAKAHPNATALIWENEVVTYSNLNLAASYAASELIALGVCPGTYIPIILPRHPLLVISLLAVLKTGAAYALLDPTWPKNRLEDIIHLLTPPLLITDQDFSFANGISTWSPSLITKGTKGFPSFPIVPPEAPCSVFFTSGTTGKPKGVVSPHSGTARLFKEKSFASFSSATIIPLAAALPWDAFSLELWSALLNGGVTWIVNEPYLSSHMLRKGVLDHGINTVWMTSSLFNMVVEEDVEAFAGLHQIMIGGEKVSVPHIKKFLEKHPEISLINGYGPVESTIFATTRLITLKDCADPDGIPIGLPIPGTQIYVLDREGGLCEKGEVGEICIAGEGLALHYLRDQRLTEKKFISLPIKDAFTRVYKTGDLGFWKKGRLYFKGREDRQVKVRGHRVELSEVECQIQHFLPEIKSCRVLAIKDSSSTSYELVAFCIPKKKGNLLKNANEILKSKLVSYQQVTALIPVEHFPLTPQGKLNEQALLALLSEEPSNREEVPLAEHCNHSTPLEKIISNVFENILNIDFISPEMPFRELGGTSLDMGRICARLGKCLHQSVPLSYLYQYPTIASLSKHLSQSNTAIQTSSTKSLTGKMTSMQAMYLTQHIINPQALTGYCLLTWLIRGEIDLQKLEKAIKYTHLKHEALSSKYTFDSFPNIQPLKNSFPSLTLLPDQTSINDATLTLRSEFSQKLDLSAGIIWRTALAPVKGVDTYVFGCVIHHIAFDGYSEHLLAKSLSEGYSTNTEMRAGSGTPLEAYIPEVIPSANGKVYIENLIDTPAISWPIGEVPADCLLGASQEYSVGLDGLLVRKIDHLAKKHALSRFEILFHYWVRSLIKLTGQHDFGIGVPVRQRITSDLEYAIGCHINMLCIRLKDASFGESEESLQKTSRLIQTSFQYQDIPFMKVLQEVKPPQKGRPPLFQTLFAFQDNPSPELHLSDLETSFIRQPYLGLPLELHAEIWPDNMGGLHLAISYHLSHLSPPVIEELAKTFLKELDNFIKKDS